MPRGYRADGTKIVPGQKRADQIVQGDEGRPAVAGSGPPGDQGRDAPATADPATKKEPRQVHNQTRTFSMAMASLDRKNFHYVKVAHTAERDEPLHFDEYMDKPSPSDPTRPMYEVVTMGETPEGRRLVGSSKMALLRCSIQDKAIEDKGKIDAAGYSESTKSGNMKYEAGQFEEFEELQGGNFSGFKVAA